MRGERLAGELWWTGREGLIGVGTAERAGGPRWLVPHVERLEAAAVCTGRLGSFVWVCLPGGLCYPFLGLTRG